LSTVDVTVQLKIAGLSDDHSAFQAATREFASDARQMRDVTLKERDVGSPGGKGFLQEFALIPSGPSAAWAVVQLVKLWIGRDRRRSIQVTIKRPGKEPIVVEASGDSLSQQTLDKAIHDALQDGSSSQD
jgi:hypothetical protein